MCICWYTNPFMPNDPNMGPTAPLTSRSSILYIYSTNIRTEYFKHAVHSPFFSLQNAVYFIMLPFLVSEQLNFLGWSCQPHAQPPAVLKDRCFLLGLSPLADQSQF